MSKKIYLDAPEVGALEKRYLNKAIDSGYVSSIGPFVPEFEQKFARYLGIGKAVSTQSGTAAIHMALHELGIGKGDEVIVPVLTFVATVNPVVYVGAKPVFVDVDIKTWNIDPKEIEKAISKRTKAIIPVHLYGNPCKMDEIISIAKKHKLYVIEDATESLGAKYKNRYTGTFGDFGCFSFNGNKTLTTGGGGMIIGKNSRRVDHIKFLVNQARDESKGYYHSEIGFNYRMTNLEAALGLAQMRKLNGFLAKKKKFSEIYKKGLKKIEKIDFQQEYRDAQSSNWLTCILLNDGIKTSRLQKELRKNGIPSRRVFMPLTEFPFYKKSASRYGNAYEIHQRGLCLPSSNLNNERDITLVSEALQRAFN